MLLYHLALGAGADPTDPRELRYAYEQDLQVLPTFATVAANLRAVPSRRRCRSPGWRSTWRRCCTAQQEITLHRPIPVAAKAVAAARIVDVLDKGKAAVIVQEAAVTESAGIHCDDPVEHLRPR